MGDGKQHAFNEVFLTISLLSQVFSNPQKKWWGYFVWGFFFFSVYFSFQVKRKWKESLIQWFSDLTSSPHCMLYFCLLCLTSATKCLSSAGVRDSPPLSPLAFGRAEAGSQEHSPALHHYWGPFYPCQGSISQHIPEAAAAANTLWYHLYFLL